jgi:sortase B
LSVLDIHSHVLPGVDDGSWSMEESIGMLGAAKASGVTAIIATPHRKGEAGEPSRIRQAYEALKVEAEKVGIDLYLGYEVHYRLFLDGGAELARAFCLAGTNVLLLEFSTGTLPLQWENTIYAIQQEGMDVIIAHPERYHSVQKDPSIAERMVQLGCELQVDVESLDVGANAAERKCARELLHRGWVGWLASDAHQRDAYDSMGSIHKKYAGQLRTPALLEEVRLRYEPHARGQEGTMHKKKRSLVPVLLIVLGVIGAALGGFFLWRGYDQSARDGAAYDALPSQVVAQTTQPASQTDESTPTPEPTEAPTPEPTPQFVGWYAPYAKPADKQIDWAELQSINPDIYAWITVEGCDIEYPVVHAEEKADPTYLDYDIYGNKNAAGAIYTDGFNAKGFSDPNTLVYGHNMRDKSMFSRLHNYEDAQFFSENKAIKVYLPDGAMLEYEIFAAYRVGNKHILAENDFSNEDVFQKYLDAIFEIRDLSANVRDVDVTADDRIITLVTCVGIDDRRLFVQGVLQHA